MANCRKETRRVHIGEAKQSLSENIAGADCARATALDGLRQLRDVKDRTLRRERERLVARYGPEHPRVAVATRSIESNGLLQQDLRIAFELASMPTAKSDDSGWQLRGHVRNQGAGVQGLTVNLCDETGAWIRAAGYSCTDKNGFFTLSIASRELPKAAFIRVTDSLKAVLYLDKQATVPVLGEVAYREIVLGKNPPCPSPEESDQPAPAPRSRATPPPATPPPVKESPAKEPLAKEPSIKEPSAKKPPAKEPLAKKTPRKGRTRGDT
jgi:hypothetical protein